MKNFVAGIFGGALFVGLFFAWDYAERSINPYEPDPEFKTDLAKNDLRELLLKIESYNVVFGSYPLNLEAIESYRTYDQGAVGCDCPGEYRYIAGENGDSYSLFSVGPDCEAMTSDDIYPDLTIEERSRIGYRVPAEKLSMQHDAPCNDT